MRLIFNVKNAKNLEISLNKGKLILVSQHLTIDQGFDTLLITSLDKLLRSIKIDSTCVKSAEILGKVDENALWGMMLKSIVQALRLVA